MPRTKVNLLPFPESPPESLTTREPPLPTVQQQGGSGRCLTYNQWYNEFEEHLFRMYGELQRVIADRYPSLKPHDTYAQFCKLIYYSSSGRTNTV